jgi:teichuronic acid biosynthesis glycosyltransferase TuaC
LVLYPAASPPEEKGFRLAKEAFRLFAKSSPGAVMLVGGQIDHDLMQFYINACDVVLLTSEFESSPMIVKEALCSKVPVVSTEIGDVRDLFGNLRGCFICQPEPNQIASALSRACGLGSIERRAGPQNSGLEKRALDEEIVSAHQSGEGRGS